MATQHEQYSRSYNSFSGCDIQATFAGSRIGEVQGISFTVMREKAPLYTMGNPDCRGYSRGKRAIAGSLIFVMFDRSALLEAFRARGNSTFMASNDQVSQRKKRFSGANPGTNRPSGLIGEEADTLIGSIATGIAAPQVAWYPDQIPPFTVVLNAINEYGHRASMAIHGVEILNHGSGISIDDISIDESMTFVATEIVPWRYESFLDPRSMSTNRLA